MKNFRLIVLFLLLFISTNSVFSDEKIFIGCGEWPPYISQNLEYYGAGARIITEAFAQSGIEVVYDFVPWNRAIELTREGYYDATPFWILTKERKNNFFTSDPLMQSESVFYSLIETGFKWKNTGDLKKYTLGVTLGYSRGNLLDKAISNGQLEVIESLSDEINFKKLLQGQIDIFVIDKKVGAALLNNSFSVEQRKKLARHPETAGSFYYHILFSKTKKANKEFARIFNRGLKILKSTGSFEMMIEELESIKYDINE